MAAADSSPLKPSISASSLNLVMENRITEYFNILKQKGKSALVTYIMGGDPDYDTSLRILKTLPEAGADIIELGIPFSDPTADGRIIQEAAYRSLAGGMNLKRILKMVSEFRKINQSNPLILMGYYNPIHKYGNEKFIRDAVKAGADGIIIVDLPFEEENEFVSYAAKSGLALIKLIAPTTSDNRSRNILRNAEGFVYYISVAGITGTKSADIADTRKSVNRIKNITDLPVAVGFGIKTPEQAAEIADLSDGVVVGSAIVRIIGDNVVNRDSLTEKVLQLVSDIKRNI